ncbi:MAG TPA: single-stranded DNA-binding protein [Rhodoblastus sp.]|nr:single-stranded DNA-binding protein [Rhodoblastus sp.]
MSGSVNKVILVGNLGRDPEVRTMPSGDKLVSFSLATTESWRDKNSGERRDKTEWHNIVIFNENLGRIAEQYCRKGSKIYLEGQLQTREYQDKDGNQRKATEVVLQRFRGELTLLDSRNSRGGEEGQSFERGASGGGSFGGGRSGGGGGGDRRPAAVGGGRSMDLDDDIPF